MRFDIGVYVPELDVEADGRRDLMWPHVMRSLVGGELDADRPLAMNLQGVWNFEKAPEVTIKRVVKAVKKYALPLLDSITTRCEMVDAIDPSWRKHCVKETLIKRILKSEA